MNLDGIRHFKAKLEHFEKAISDDTLSEKIAQKGAEMAREAYSGISATVTVEKSGKNGSIIQASGKGLTYIEYGTGRVGEASGYPSDKLPKDQRTFVSAGKVQTTNGWEYYYDNPDTKANVNGQDGWFLGKTFVTGRPSGMQMLNTALKLRDDMPEIVRDIIAGD